MGSTREARRAGREQASASVSGSAGLSPKSWLRTNFPPAIAAGTPMATPAAIISMASRRTSRTTPIPDAPSVQVGYAEEDAAPDSLVVQVANHLSTRFSQLDLVGTK